MTRSLLLDSAEALAGARISSDPGHRDALRSPRRAALLSPLLSSLLTASLLGLLLAPPRAEAACTPNPPTSGDSVTCSGTDEDGFDASGAEGLTIGTSGPTEMNDSDPAVDAALRVSDDNVVTLDFDSTVTVGEADGAGVRGGDRNDVTNLGAITVDGDGGVAIDVGSSVDATPTEPSPPDVVNSGTITLNGANSVGLRSVDNYVLTNSVTGIITVDAAATGAVAMQGQNLTSDGTIQLDADDARGLVIGDNAGLPNPNQAALGAGSTTTVNGTNGIALEVGNNVETVASGTITLSGDSTIGLAIGDKTSSTSQADHTNQGTISVEGSGATGIQAGDGWYGSFDDNTSIFDPVAVGIGNFGTIEVTGSSATGLSAGDAANTAGNNNSFVLNEAGATINVTGENAIGLLIGGNDVLDPTDSAVDGLYSFDNGGTVSGGADASFLVLFREPVAGSENRLRNRAGGRIEADLTNQGSPLRGIAVMGTAGAEVIENAGTIVGDLMLGEGSNVFTNSGSFTGNLEAESGDDDVTNSGTFTGDLVLGEGDNTFTNSGTFAGDVSFGDGDDNVTLSGGSITSDLDLAGGDDLLVIEAAATPVGTALDGGAGTADALELGPSTATLRSFDLGTATNFEVLRLRGDSAADPGWQLVDGADWTGPVEVLANAALTANTPLILGGDLTIDPSAALSLNVDGESPALTVRGDASLAGAVTVTTASSLGPGTYRVVQVDGTRTGTFDPDATVLPASAGLLLYTSAYDAQGFLLTLASNGGFVGVAQGSNNRSVAGHLDAIFADGTADPLMNSVLSQFAESSAPLDGLFTALSPEAYDAQTAVAVESGRRLARLFFGRPRDCGADDSDPWAPRAALPACHARRLSAWVSGIGSFRSRDAFSGHPGYDAQIGGAVLGIDFAPIDALEFSLALSGQGGTVDVDLAGESDLSFAEVTGHVAWTRGGLRLQGVAGYGHGFHDSKRSVVYTEVPTSQIVFNGEDDFQSRRVTLAAHAGYLFSLGPIDLEPTLAADWVWIDQDEVDEGAQLLFANDVSSRDDVVISATAGLQVSTLYHHTRYLHTNLEWIDGVWRPSVALRWRQYLAGYDRSIDARLMGAPDTVGDYRVEAKEDQGGLEIEAGISFVPKHANRLQFDLRYEAYRASHTVDHDLVAKVRFGF